jgi:predicted NAD/FAD-binding protein
MQNKQNGSMKSCSQSPTGAEQSVLGAFQTTASQTLLHTDDRLLPACNDARAAWNYHLGGDGTETRPAATLTYDMNRLQSLRTPETYCVTLNRTPSIDPAKILRQMEYRHPLYTLAAVRAQARWAEISGQTSGQTSGRADGDRHLHFCGAYWFYGFHEDGLNSAIRVASALGVDW